MNRTGTSWLLLLVVSASVVCLIPKPATADSLWDKATLVASDNQGWIPGQIYIRLEELDKQGHSVEIDETWNQLALDQNGTVVSTLKKRMKNGQDITAEAQKEKTDIAVEVQSENKEQAEKDADQQGTSVSVANPFEPDKQGEVQVTRLAKTEQVLGTLCFVYSFEQKTGPDTKLVGTAWLQEKTGIPVQITYTLSPLPRFTHKMETTIHYAIQSPSEWYPRSMIIEASAGILFIRKNFRSTVQFSEYWPQKSKK